MPQLDITIQIASKLVNVPAKSQFKKWAQAALRVIGTCMATGQAAGVAAALQTHSAAEVRAKIETEVQR